MPEDFVHLHLHSEFSLQDSTVRLKPMLAEVRNRGMGAVALTDLNNLFAMVKMYKASIGLGIKPLFGADVWIYHPERKETLSRLVLLCRNDEGYLNLKKLISDAYRVGQLADRPTINIDHLKTHHQGLIALSGCLEGDIGHAVKMQNKALGSEYLSEWLDIFQNRFFSRNSTYWASL